MPLNATEPTTVTEAARALQRAGLIAGRQGWVTILDRQRLEVSSCGCPAALPPARRTAARGEAVPKVLQPVG